MCSFDCDEFRIELLRRRLSIRAFAEAADVSPAYLYQIVNGYRPSADVLERIRRALGSEAARRVMAETFDGE